MPANIRISAQFPFPSSVQGAAPVKLIKQNGIWTVSLDAGSLASQSPGASPTDYVIVWDSVANTWFRTPLSGLPAGGAGGAHIRVQRSVTASPIVLVGIDEILNCNINVAAACALPAAASRVGLPLTFKDVGAQAGAHNITLTPNGGETIDGAASLVLNVNRQGVTLVPFNDGINSGWMIQ